MDMKIVSIQHNCDVEINRAGEIKLHATSIHGIAVIQVKAGTLIIKYISKVDRRAATMQLFGTEKNGCPLPHHQTMVTDVDLNQNGLMEQPAVSWQLIIVKLARTQLRIGMELSGFQLVKDVVHSLGGRMVHLVAIFLTTVAAHARTQHMHGMEVNIFQLVKDVVNRNVGGGELGVVHQIHLVTKLAANTEAQFGIGLVTNFEGVGVL